MVIIPMKAKITAMVLKSFFPNILHASSYIAGGIVLSEYAAMTGSVLESWLEKKSKRTGFWNKVTWTSSLVKCILYDYTVF